MGYGVNVGVRDVIIRAGARGMAQQGKECTFSLRCMGPRGGTRRSKMAAEQSSAGCTSQGTEMKACRATSAITDPFCLFNTSFTLQRPCGSIHSFWLLPIIARVCTLPPPAPDHRSCSPTIALLWGFIPQKLCQRGADNTEPKRQKNERKHKKALGVLCTKKTHHFPPLTRFLSYPKSEPTPADCFPMYVNLSSDGWFCHVPRVDRMSPPVAKYLSC